MTGKISLKPVRQTEGFCGPSSLVSLLDFYGIKTSEDDVARACGSTREHGTGHAALVRALEKFGLRSVEREDGTWQDLKKLTEKGVPAIVGWHSDFEEPADDHYSVVYKVTDKNIFLMDPEVGGTRRISKENFLKRWRDFDSSIGRVTKGWYLYALHKEGGRG